MGLPAAIPPIIITRISSNDKPRKKGEKKNKSLNIYCERRYKASEVELLIIQPLKELLGIGNITPL